MKTAAARFAALSSARTTALDAAREASRLTIPGLIPTEGQNEHFVSSQPYQSVGSHGVRVLSARLLLALFPTSVPFFRLELDAGIAEALGQDKNAADTTLAQFSQSATSVMEDARVRPAMAEGLRHLIIAGNVLLRLPLEGSPRLYRLDQYVVKRDETGQFTDIIAVEKVYPSTLPEAVRVAVKVTTDPDKAEQAVNIYTVVERRDGTVKHWQEINGTKVPGSEGSAPADKSGWLPLRWLAVPGSDYGRSHVTEYLGDLLGLEDLSQSIIQMAAAASRIINLVNPNSSLDTAELAAAQSGDYLYGLENDVASLQLNKSQDFSVMRATSETIEARVSTAFLIQSFRNAERVTAEEVRTQSEELENTLGGTYSLLSSELQQPVAERYLYIAERQNLIPALPNGIKAKVITGLAALGRAAEVNRLRTWAADAIQIIGPEQFAANVNATALLNRLGVEHGVTGLTSLLKTEDQKAEEQQQAAMAQAAQSAAPAFADAAISAAAQDPNQGT